MGSRVIKEYWCDTCGKEFRSEHAWYHTHIKYAGGSALWHLSTGIRKAKDEEAAFDELCDHFGFSSRTSVINVRHAFYDEDVIHCIIEGMRENMIHNENWETDADPVRLSDRESAAFIEMNVHKLKKAYNAFIDRAYEQKRNEMNQELECLKERKV